MWERVLERSEGGHRASTLNLPPFPLCLPSEFTVPELLNPSLHSVLELAWKDFLVSKSLKLGPQICLIVSSVFLSQVCHILFSN